MSYTPELCSIPISPSVSLNESISTVLIDLSVQRVCRMLYVCVNIYIYIYVCPEILIAVPYRVRGVDACLPDDA